MMQKVIDELRESMRTREDYMSAVELEERGFSLEELGDGSISITIPAKVLDNVTDARWISILLRLAVMDVAAARLNDAIEKKLKQIEAEREAERNGRRKK